MSKLIRSFILCGAMMGLAAGSMTMAQEKGGKKEAPKADDKKSEAKAEGKFEVYKDKGGKFRYRILGKDGKSLGGATKGYDKREEVVEVIKAIQEMAKSPITDEK